jgi:2-amino-4-hydroxy-6-hydroxymethyldihydropteridine diphosphokinase
MTVCHLALGSNINPTENLTQAIEHLEALPNFHLEAVSPCYQTEPWGIAEQADFLNLVLRGRWESNVRELLQASLGIEASLNRARRIKNGPRTIDIDILLFGDEQYHSDELTVPHPGLYERDFMLMPLLDISPNALDPISQVPLKTFQGTLPYRCIRHQVQIDLME